jgi:peptidoglycan/xylan/chitin deacetylase (PgdA/CDA1 family)
MLSALANWLIGELANLPPMRFHWLLPDIKGIPVLMYHRVWPGLRDGLTVMPEDLRAHWTWLREAGYECLTMDRFLAAARGESRISGKAFLLTFDDGYRNNLTYVLPLLREFGWEATIFLIAGTLDGSVGLDEGSGPAAMLGVEELRGMIGPNIRFGLHGYHHENFSKTSIEDLEQVLRTSCSTFEGAGIPYQKVLAYPYGARPKDANDFFRLKAWMSDFGIEAAFRIGNKPQRLPAMDLYELKRIDIRGEDSLEDFRIKLRKGKLKPF